MFQIFVKKQAENYMLFADYHIRWVRMKNLYYLNHSLYHVLTIVPQYGIFVA